MDLLFGILRRRGVTRGADIQRGLGISQPVMSRLIRDAGARICRIGRGPATRYALSREIMGLGSQTPVYRVDESGRPSQLGTLYFLAGGMHWWERQLGQGQLFNGLPPFVDDMKTQGYLGRRFPALYPDLRLPGRITDWSDDYHLIALALRGEDYVGNLIVGEESLNRFLAQPPQTRTRADYQALARGTLAGQPGSSAGGEHPKFAVYSEPRHLLVKFAVGDGAAADRWRDLLVCEHIALETLREAGIPAAQPAWFDSAGDRFLEVERFDRVGKRGRRGVISLLTITCHHLGRAPDSWSRMAQYLLAESSLSIAGEDAKRLVWLDTFGDLIANTDRHCGNVSFFMEEAEAPVLALTPVYDMLPMAFAPRGASVVEVAFVPQPPTATNLHIWGEVARHALKYWDRLSTEGCLTPAFREISTASRDSLANLIVSVAL